MNAILLASLSLLARAQDAATGAEGTSPAPSAGPNMFVLLGGVLLIFYFLAWRPQAKERKKREGMLASMKKGDRVMTSSGIHGTVAALSEKDVTIKVDEKTGTRIRFARSAVQNILGGDEAEVVEKTP